MARHGQCIFISVYRAKLAGQLRLITVTWRKNLLLHALSLSIQSADRSEEETLVKIELKPWSWCKKHGAKRFLIDGKTVDLVWDLQAAKFTGEAEPISDYYVAVACDEEVVLVVGDLRKDAFKRTRCRPALKDPLLLSRTEHIFSKRKFTTRFRLHERSKLQEVAIRFANAPPSAGYFFRPAGDPQLEIKVDGQTAMHVDHLQWKFRGNHSFHVSARRRIEVCWDVHDWLFNSGPRCGLFMFRPASPPPKAAPFFSPAGDDPGTNRVFLLDDDDGDGSSGFCLFVYAWLMD